ncbi:MAG TPA: SdrD B-like domain-containing protein, partial [Methylomirabilota bacterium]|nr:SdrD B-like domain-containing protein [Methylomirabilota bacterium]
DGYLSGEAALVGWTVTLKKNGYPVGAPALTDANGNYCFNNLEAATYTVVVAPKPDYTVTFPNGCNNQREVTLTGCQNKTGIDFGYTGTKAGVDLVVTGPGSAPCGQKITYTFTVKNTGNTCLYGGMRVEAALLGGQIFHKTPVNPGEEFTFTKDYLVKSSDEGTLKLTAKAIGDPPGGLAIVTKTVYVNTTVTCTPPPPPCVAGGVGFYGNTALSGAAGNIRSFTATNGVQVKVSAFSRKKSDGAWNPAYLGLFSGGLGVTDIGEGTGGNNSHTTDNVGDRVNYVLFEFSQPIVLKKAALGYVVTDSDMKVWIGTAADPFYSHLTLSDGVLSDLGYWELNGGGGSARWAALNDDDRVGNVVVIAADPGDAACNDQFKIKMLDICRPGALIPPCPSPWNTKDIGSCNASGNAGYSGGTFTVCGSGSDIWNAADDFRYVYTSASGDCTIIAKVASVGNTDPWAKAGVMIRETLNSGSEHASMFITPGNGAAFQSRTSTGGTSLHVAGTGAAPCWVKVVRTGSSFKGYTSSNGSTWTLVGTQTINMTTSVYIGLGVTSHNNGAICTSVFQNVTASP